MSDMSRRSDITKLTPVSQEEDELVLALDGEEINRLEAALSPLAASSRAAARLTSAIHHALENGHVLVLGASEGGGPEAEKELRARILELIERMVPDLKIPSDAAAILARRNATRRAELLEEFGALTGEQIAEERSRATNRHALAARWRKEGRLFGVPHRGQTVYPGFQFDDDGGVRAVIREVLEALPRAQMSDWEVALWWTSANGWLGGQRPADLLGGDPAPLVAAAEKLAEPLPL
jgi:hypothetical protein